MLLEWVSGCCLTPSEQYFMCITGKTSYASMRWWCPTLYQTNTLSWIFIVLAHRNNSPRIDMSLHSDTLSWLRANQSLFFLFNATCLVEKQYIPILYSLVWRDRGSNLTIYRNRGNHANHCTPDAVICHWKVWMVE